MTCSACQEFWSYNLGDLERSRSYWLDICHKVTHANAEGFGDPYQRVEGDIGLAAFHFTDIIGVQVGKLSESLVC
jgi:hypothetical protein